MLHHSLRRRRTAGKARSAQNAFRHGLNIPVLSDPLLAPEVEAMARRISSPCADAESVECARRIAEAQFDLNRVRSSRRQLITRFLVDRSYQPRQVHRQRVRLLNMVLGGRLRAAPIELDKIEQMISPVPPEGEEKLAVILRESILELGVLDRYERRALSRRKRAIRNFDAARTLGFSRGPYGF
jgi:hypothetical protein